MLSKQELQEKLSTIINAMPEHIKKRISVEVDGEKLVINDLSNHKYEDDFPATLESGIRKLLMTPQEFLAEQKTINDMKRFLDALNNDVN